MRSSCLTNLTHEMFLSDSVRFSSRTLSILLHSYLPSKFKSLRQRSISRAWCYHHHACGDSVYDHVQCKMLFSSMVKSLNIDLSNLRTECLLTSESRSPEFFFMNSFRVAGLNDCTTDDLGLSYQTVITCANKQLCHIDN